MDLKINMASFEDAWELQRVVSNVAKKEGIKISDLTSPDRLDKIVNFALSVNGDKEVFNALWACLARCLYNGEKITKATFDDAEARKDYLPVITKCIEVNLEPFTDGLLSVWKMLFRNPETGQKS